MAGGYRKLPRADRQLPSSFREALHRYLKEFSFRFNNREAEDIFAMMIVKLAIGKALRYKALTAKTASAPNDAS